MYKKGDKIIMGVALTPDNIELVEYLSAYYGLSRAAAIRLALAYISDMVDDFASPEILRGYLE